MSSYLEPRDSLKAFDSPTTRELESLLALRMDLGFIGILILELEGNMEAIADLVPDRGELPRHGARAYWDVVTLALLRHYKHAPRGSVSGLYDDVLAALGPEFVAWFQRLEARRDKQVAHPIGHEEAHAVLVDLAEEPPKISYLSFVVEGPDPQDIPHHLIPFFNALCQATTERIDELQARIKAEVRGLSREELSKLPGFRLRTKGRRFGA